MLSALALCGCATFSQDGGFGSVATASRSNVGKEVRWARTAAEKAKSEAQVTALLEQDLSAEDAVQIALLNNPSLQASFEELGISEADLVESGRLPNPRFTLRHAASAAQYDIEETLSFNVLALFTLPYAHSIAKQRFAQAQISVVAAIVRLTNDARQAYFASLAARESTHYLEQVQTAAETAAELTRRMVAAGNWSRLELAREQGFYSDARQRLTRARLAEDAAREKLLRLLGLSDTHPLKLADKLPELPRETENLPDIEQTLLGKRVDLQLRRMQIDALARALGLVRATRFVNVLDAGPTRVLQGPKTLSYERGYEVILEVPVFDGGGVRVRRAEALYLQAVDGFAQAAIDARSQIRQAYASYRAAFDLARQQRDETLPSRKLVAAEGLLRYNASLISIFDLLSDARAEIGSVNDYIQSVRDFWIAKSDLDTALLGDSSP